MNEITTVGVDLAKEVIAVCAADGAGRIVFTRGFRRDTFAQWAVQLPPCRFGMEACGAAHHWARMLTGLGHTVKLLAAAAIKPFVKPNFPTKSEKVQIYQLSKTLDLI